MQMPSKRCCRSDFRQQGLIRETQEFSVLDSIYPHFGAVIGARRDGQEKTVKTFSSLPEVSGGAGTQRRGNLGEEPVMIGIYLLKNTDIAFSPRDVDAFSA